MSSVEMNARREASYRASLARQAINTPAAQIELPLVPRFDVAAGLASLGFDQSLIAYFQGVIEIDVQAASIKAFSNVRHNSPESHALRDRAEGTWCHGRQIVAMAHVCDLIGRQRSGEEGFLLVTGGLTIFQVPNHKPSEPPPALCQSYGNGPNFGLEKFALEQQAAFFSVLWAEGRWHAGLGEGFLFKWNNGPRAKNGQHVRAF